MIGLWLVLACAPEPDLTVDAGDPLRVVLVADTPDIQLVREGAEGPVAGRITEQDGRYRYVPVAPLAYGTRYEVQADGVIGHYDTPPPPPREDIAIRVFPGVAQIPANHLRFYVRFSEPMRSPPDLFGTHIQLLDADGHPVDLAFSEVPLWTPDRTQLTAILHPGRQKRDIGFGQGLPPILEEGGTVTLRIAPTLPDAQGRPLGVEVLREFTVGPEDRTRPDPGQWTLEPPESADAPATVVFDEPLDPWIAATAFAIEGPQGEIAVTAEPHAASLSFHPDGSWPSGELTLRRTGRIEDLAANSPERLFEFEAGTEPDPMHRFEAAFQAP